MVLYIICILIPMLNICSDPFANSVAIVTSSSSTKTYYESNDDLSQVALETFMNRTDSDLAKYIKPHLASAIKEASSSPESDDESPSPNKVMRAWVRSPESIRTTPKTELDGVILSAVQKAFEENESIIAHKTEKIESMFSKKTTALITSFVSVMVTIASSVGSVYGTLSNLSNCTK